MVPGGCAAPLGSIWLIRCIGVATVLPWLGPVAVLIWNTAVLWLDVSCAARPELVNALRSAVQRLVYGLCAPCALPSSGLDCTALHSLTRARHLVGGGDGVGCSGCTAELPPIPAWLTLWLLLPVRAGRRSSVGCAGCGRLCCACLMLRWPCVRFLSGCCSSLPCPPYLASPVTRLKLWI